MKLIFVYNAKSGLSNHMMDALHKTFSPSTYDCDLCSLTYGHVAPRKEWKSFLKEIDMTSQFHYKDRFKAAHPELKDAFPAIYLESQNGIQLLVNRDQMNGLKNVSELISLIKNSISISSK